MLKKLEKLLVEHAVGKVNAYIAAKIATIPNADIRETVTALFAGAESELEAALGF